MGHEAYSTTAWTWATLESPDFIGRAVAALAADPASCFTPQVLAASASAQEFGFTVIGGTPDVR